MPPSAILTTPQQIVRAIVYGNTATELKEPTESQTHNWTVYVRSPSDQYEIGNFVRKVIFKLHNSFAQPKRTVDKPPFEVSEAGWGEFEIIITLFFADPAEKPVRPAS